METMVLNFATFKLAVAKQFARMQQHQMFRVQVERNELWDVYLKSCEAIDAEPGDPADLS